MQIESKKKKLCLEPLRGIITQGEKMADTVAFRLPATYGALVLSDLSWQIRAASEKNTLATADLTASASGEFCLVQWEVSADFTAVSGALSLMLVGTDSAGNVVIKFPGDDPIWVRDAEAGQYSPPEDAIQKALNGLQQAESALEEATKALQEIGINFKILGHYGTLPELEAAVTSPSPGDAYGVGDPTVVYVWNGTSWAPLPGVFQPYPHTNLLVNPRFKYNSRSQQSYSTTGNDFTVDGWMLQGNQNQATVAVSANGIVFTQSAGNQGIYQLLKKPLETGKTYTISVSVNGTVYTGTLIWQGSSVFSQYPGQNVSFGLDTDAGQYRAWVYLDYRTQSSSVTITAAKFELGSVSTLQAELDNPPPEDVEKLKLDMYDLDPGRCAYLPWHNENLLDNWYFIGGGSQQGGGQFPINQRGQTSYSYSSNGAYFIDRWVFLDANSSATLNSDNITLFNSSTATGGKIALSQFIESSRLEKNAPYVLSVLVDEISQGSNWLISTDMGDLINAAVTQPGLVSQQLIFTAQKDKINIYIWKASSNSNDNIKIKAVKLELGYLSTLARKDESGNWVLNDAPPNFQQELAKCQRYFVKLNGYAWVGSGQIDAGNKSGQFFIPTPVPMRIKPGISGVLRLYNSKNNSDVGIVGLSGFNENGVNGILNVSSFDDSSGTSISMWINTGEALELSADL